MEYITISTGSREGNCHALRSGRGQILLLDLGATPDTIKRGINFRISDVVGALVTHSHLDHAKSADALSRMGINVIKGYENVPQLYVLGEFRVMPFALEHDVPCVGYMVYHEEMGKLLYVTDTEYVRYRFQDIAHVLIGVDYDKQMLAKDHPAYEHIARGHMELQTAKEFIRITAPAGKVILCHLSEENSCARLFAEEIGKYARDVNIAHKGLKINLGGETNGC